MPEPAPTPDAPRLPPLPESEWSERVRELIEPTEALGGPYPLGVFTTIAYNPKVFSSWLRFSSHLLVGSTLDVRDRERLILRAARNCRSRYEWVQHERIGAMVGLSAEEMDEIGTGPDAADEPLEAMPPERLLLRVADRLHRDHDLDDATWAALVERFPEASTQVELLMLVGQYTMLAGVLNTLRVQVETDPSGAPAPSAPWER